MWPHTHTHTHTHHNGFNWSASEIDISYLFYFFKSKVEICFSLFKKNSNIGTTSFVYVSHYFFLLYNLLKLIDFFFAKKINPLWSEIDIVSIFTKYFFLVNMCIKLPLVEANFFFSIYIIFFCKAYGVGEQISFFIHVRKKNYISTKRKRRKRRAHTHDMTQLL